jgi:SSS family solute:Na+ symporter
VYVGRLLPAAGLRIYISLIRFPGVAEVTASAVAMTIIFGIIVFGAATGIYAGLHREMNLEQWTVGGRRFGLLLFWLLMAGDIYTTFSFLGAGGFAYSRGGPTLYIIAYLTLAYVISFFLGPRVWEVGKKFSLHTQSDLILLRYRSKHLAAIVALVGVVFLIPYLQLQLTGLGIIVQVASFDAISRPLAITIGFVIVAGFVLSSGIRAVAWVSVLKDALMLIAVVCVGFGVPYHYFGGIGPMFQTLIPAKAQHFTMPGSTTTMGHSWFITTILLNACGCYMWPSNFGPLFSAKSADTLRRNAVIMPLYNLMLPLLFFVGFAAMLVTPGLKDSNLALLTIVRKTFPPWFLGLVGGAGALTAMVPAAVIVLTAGTLFAKNIVRPLFVPAMSDDAVARLAKIMVVVFSALALYIAVHSSQTLVGILLFAYNGISQLFPAVVLGLYWKRATATGVLAGLFAGVGCAMFLVFSNHDPLFGVNAGFIALCINLAVTTLVSLVTVGISHPLEDQVASAAFVGSQTHQVGS